MALFQLCLDHVNARPRRRRKRKKNHEWLESGGETDEDGSALSLTRLCLLSLADNMKNVWTKDYAENYMDQYSFRYIMGPFNCLPGDLVEDLTVLLCARKELSRAALHLLLVPQCRSLSLESCPSLVTCALCSHISARCHGLLSLNLSGAQQLRPKVLCQTLTCLPGLRSLTLAGVPCDKFVIETITHFCRSLRHLDVSRCPLLSPASLLPLVGGPFCSSSDTLCSSPPSSAAQSPLPLTSLLALDIGFSERDIESVTAATYLLLSLPFLERVALESVGEACCLIHHRRFSQTDDFFGRVGVPKLEEVWKERKLKQEDASWKKMKGANEEENERMLWEDFESDDSRDDTMSSSQIQAEENTPFHSGLTLQLKDVRGLTCESINSLKHLCPGISSLSITITDDPDVTRGRCQSSLLAEALKVWSGQLQRLSVEFSGPLVDLLPAIQVAGPSLVSLTLDGVKTSNDTPLLEVIATCPRLKELLITAEAPTTPQERSDEEVFDNLQHPPSLPHLTSLSISFFQDHSQWIPVMSWRSLREALWCLLIGSPLLRKLSLVSLPCRLDSIFESVLKEPCMRQSSPLLPLARLQNVNLQRTDMNIKTLRSLLQWSRRLKQVDVSQCWEISQCQLATLKMFTNVQVIR